MIALVVMAVVPINHAYSGNIADLELTISPVVISDSSFGEIGEFTLTVTNLGPDDAGFDIPGPFPISVATEPLLINPDGFLDMFFAKNFNISQECGFVQGVADPLPGDPPQFDFLFLLPGIPAGTSITCYGLYGMGITSGRVEIEWSVFNPIDTDPVIENDFVTMSFGIAPPVIPTLSIWGMLLLILAVLGLFFRHNRLLKT